jgi:hypothetical protein
MPLLLCLLLFPASLDLVAAAAAAAVTGSAMESASPALLLHAAQWCTTVAAGSWCNLSTHNLLQLLKKNSKQLLLQQPAAAV